ncbi:hypothetical protein HYR99_23860 [Candidatus Poribacteria bacterium]|nr:hypothetical protein [Candidatus Poribacteria bacterium]
MWQLKNRIPEYQRFDDKKYQEASKRKHKRGLVLTDPKLVRLSYVLLRRGEIYQPEKAQSLS